MKYLLMIYCDEAADAQRSKEELEQEMGAYWAFTNEVKKPGAYMAGEALHPTSTATTVRVRDGKTLTTDGPFAETKEQLGGYYVVDCKNLDEAIQVGGEDPARVDIVDRSPADRRFQSKRARKRRISLWITCSCSTQMSNGWRRSVWKRRGSAIAHHWGIMDEAAAKGVFRSCQSVSAVRRRP